MVEVRDLIPRMAKTDVAVLIRGESGTGKDLVARALCAFSPRHDKPFIKVRCTARPNELLEPELFGFERGASPTAIEQKPGKFEFANGGTIFLDDIGEMSLPLQGRLLQMLENGNFVRLGGTQAIHVDVRVVAATRHRLERCVADGRFREDLHSCLNAVSVDLPPLRERREEIAPLTDHFLKKYSVQYNKLSSPLSENTARLFMEYDWPGNVRELEKLIERAVVLGEGPVRNEIAHGIAMAAHRAHAPSPDRTVSVAGSGAGIAKLPSPVAITTAEADSCSLKLISRRAARVAERELILKMLQQTRWNRKETAGMLGISYKALLYKIKENGLDKVS
jgi:DNA-binding NtrC family response regulator